MFKDMGANAIMHWDKIEPLILEERRRRGWRFRGLVFENLVNEMKKIRSKVEDEETYA
jgi:hypothetical protein